MTVTRIEKTNEAFFAPFFLEASGLRGGNRLRIGAVEDGVACAAASFEIYGSTAELTTIFVAPAYRRRGLGRALLDAFSSLAAGTGVTSLTTTFLPEPKDGLREFFESAGFELFGGSPALAVSFEDAKNADTFNKYLAKADKNGAVLAFSALSEAQKHELDALVRPYGVELADITVGSFSPELSYVCYRNGSLAAALFCSEPDRQLNVDFLLSRVSSAGPTLAIVEKLADRLKAREQPPERIVFLAANPVVPAIAEELFGRAAQTVNTAVYGTLLFDEA